MTVEHLRESSRLSMSGKTATERTNSAGRRKCAQESLIECPEKVNNIEEAHSLSSFGMQNKKSQFKPKHAMESTSQKHQTIGDYQVKQCSFILEKLMNHKFGWIFNQPVDPVKLMIPDYFSIITKPMDLGTIKNKLQTMQYNYVTEFVDDVQLTFANAMQYNPPSNDVHIIANKLNNIFNLDCKSLEVISEKQKLSTFRRKTNKKVQKSNLIVQRKSSNCPPSFSRQPLTHLGSRDVKTACRQHITRAMLKDSERISDSTSKCSVGLSNNIDNKRLRTLAGVEFDHFNADDSATNINVDTTNFSTYPTNPAVTSTGNGSLQDWLPSSRPLRAAILKSRFAETISKAQQKTTHHPVKKRDLENMQKRLKLEKEHQEEMARLDVQIKNSAEAELKLQREKAREASRLILQNMEKTVDIDENYGLLKDVQSLHYSEQHPVMFEELMVNFSDGLEILGTSGNPLEQLGLFMKDDDIDVNSDDGFPRTNDGNTEEGEIEPTLSFPAHTLDWLPRRK